MNSFGVSHLGMTILAIATVISTPAIALKEQPGRFVNPLFFQAPECAQRPDFLSTAHPEIVGGFNALPKSVFVAREAEMWVEGNQDGKNVKLHSYQSFVRPKEHAYGRVICGTTPENFSNRFSMMAPTLIDASSEHKVGNSMWQFQVIADQKGYSVWNKQSPSFSRAAALDQVLKNEGSQYRLFQISHNEYELLVQKNSGGVVESLAIRYESLR